MASRPKYDVIRKVLEADVANAATFTVNFPTGRTLGSYALSSKHRVYSNKYGLMKDGDTVAFALTTLATITNNTGITLEAGTEFQVQLNLASGDLELAEASEGRMLEAKLFKINLGSPRTIDADGIAAAQSATGAHTLALNGAQVVGGVWTADVPRNVIVDSGGADTAVLTVIGTDEYGAAMRENITLNGTTAVAGKKAFKTVTSITSSATIANGAFVGEGDVLGLPCFLSDLGRITRELEDGITATAGTAVKGVKTKATATSGDVRGTYDPNSAADGTKAFTLFIALDDPSDKGVAQFAG